MIFEDANLENTLTWTINGIMNRSGQTCLAAFRVSSKKSIASSFLEKDMERMRVAVKKMSYSPAPDTNYGLLVDTQGPYSRQKDA